MLRIIIYGLLAYLVYRGLKTLLIPPKRPLDQDGGKVFDEMLQDPFCGKYVPRMEAVRRTLKGEVYFFCSESCAEQFEKEQRTEEKG